MAERTRVAVVGGGAVGGLLAAAAADAGHEVTVWTRTPFLDLVIEAEGRRHVPDVTVATDIAGARPAPWVMLATKAHDTPADALAALCAPGTTLVVAQNGIDHRERLDPLANGASVLPALVYAAAERAAPGHVIHHGYQTLVVPAGEDADALAALLPGVRVRGEADFATAAWRKLLGNLAANPVTALTGRRMEVFADPDAADLAHRLLAEGAAVGRADGAALADDEADRVFGAYAHYPPDSGSSMLYDRLAGRPLEHELITGAVVARADAHGVDVPVNRTVLALLRALAPPPTGRDAARVR